MAGMKVEISEETINLVRQFERALNKLENHEGDDQAWNRAYEKYKGLRNRCAVRLVAIVDFGGDHAGS